MFGTFGYFGPVAIGICIALIVAFAWMMRKR